MKIQNIYRILNIDDLSATPKYLQLANSIIKGIDLGNLEKDDVLPSINDLSFEFDISRDTVEKGYRYLKKTGVLGSVPGKGYFIKNTNIGQKFKIFLLFNKLSAHKKIVYDSFVSALGDHATIDFYIYNNDFSLFKRLLTQKKDDYTHYVIIPHFVEGGEHAHEIINQIPKEKLILLDKKLPGVTGVYAAVYENFEKDIYCALEGAIEKVKKYHTINLIFPANSYYPEEIQHGLLKFCQDYAFQHRVIHDIEKEDIRSGELYINVMEDDLVTLIEKILTKKMNVGKEVGVISYNETPMKKIILDGITTISTDFQKMGEISARLILNNSKEHSEVPFRLTLRPSL